MKSKTISLREQINRKLEEMNGNLDMGMHWGNTSKEMLRDLQRLLDQVKL